MKRLTKCKKGMTMLEVIMAMSVLALVSVPLIVSFMNSLMVARLSKKQTEINAVTRVVKEMVVDGFNNDYELGGNIIGDADTDDDKYSEMFVLGSVCTSPDQAVRDNTKYEFRIKYDPSEDYMNSKNVLVYVFEEDTGRVVNRFKIAIYTG